MFVFNRFLLAASNGLGWLGEQEMNRGQTLHRELHLYGDYSNLPDEPNYQLEGNLLVGM